MSGHATTRRTELRDKNILASGKREYRYFTCLLSGNQAFKRPGLRLAIVQKFSVDVSLFDRYFSDKVWVDARRIVT